jgi:hypothetical protein
MAEERAKVLFTIYFENKANFTKRGLNKRIALHELYHHLVYANNLDLPEAIE